MKKNLLLLFTIISFNLSAQQWGPVGCGMGGVIYTMTTDTVNHTLYLGGYFQNLLCPPFYSTVGIAMTDGNTLFDVGGYGTRPFGSHVRASIMFQGKLIIGGTFDSIANIKSNNIASWDGVQWDSLSSGMRDTITAPVVEAFAVYDGQLYAAGRFTNAGGVSCNNIAKWNGTSWNPLGSGITNNPNTLDEVWCMLVFQNELIVGGYFNYAGGVPSKDIARWNGVTWDSLGPGLANSPNNSCAFVWALEEYNNELYAAGQFNKSGNKWRQQVAKWDGTEWDSLSTGLNNGGTAHSLTVYRNRLILGGDFHSVGNVPLESMAAWDGNIWSDMGGAAVFNQQGNDIFSLRVMDSCLYAGGLINYLYNHTVYTPYLAKYCDGSVVTSVVQSAVSPGSLMPVPANDILLFDPGNNEIYQLRIYDINGKNILDFISCSNKKQVDISALAAGVYFIETNSAAGSFHYKFIKE